MTSDDLREIFKNACTAEPLAEGWPELEKFGKAVIDACIGVCEDARASPSRASSHPPSSAAQSMSRNKLSDKLRKNKRELSAQQSRAGRTTLHLSGFASVRLCSSLGWCSGGSAALHLSMVCGWG